DGIHIPAESGVACGDNTYKNNRNVNHGNRSHLGVVAYVYIKAKQGHVPVMSNWDGFETDYVSQAAAHKHSCQRDQKCGQLETLDYGSLNGAKHSSCGNHHQGSGYRVPAHFLDEDSHAYTYQGDDRADGKVDAARQYDVGHSNGCN